MHFLQTLALILCLSSPLAAYNGIIPLTEIRSTDLVKGMFGGTFALGSAIVWHSASKLLNEDGPELSFPERARHFHTIVQGLGLMTVSAFMLATEMSREACTDNNAE